MCIESLGLYIVRASIDLSTFVDAVTVTNVYSSMISITSSFKAWSDFAVENNEVVMHVVPRQKL